MVGSVDARVGTEVKHAEELELVINDFRHTFPDSITSSRPSRRSGAGHSMKVSEEHDFMKPATSASSASDSQVRSGGGVIAYQGIHKYVSCWDVRRSDQGGGTYGHGHGQEHEQRKSCRATNMCTGSDNTRSISGVMSDVDD